MTTTLRRRDREAARKAREDLLALQEEHIKRRCEASFSFFVREAWRRCVGTRLDWSWHLDVICDALQDCAEGRCANLIINVPPRTLKSWVVNVFYPVWVWIGDPAHQFLNCSHAQPLAQRDTLRSRGIVQSAWYARNWGDEVKISQAQGEKGNYQTTAGGHRVAFGVNSGVTGHGADTEIIDDPHDARKALSEADRKTVFSLLTETLPSRFNKQPGVTIVVMQRLHEEDATGILLQRWQDAGIPYRHICLPMRFEPDHPHRCPEDIRAEKGELLMPARFPAEVLARLEGLMTAYGVAGQHQQRPAPEGGGIIKESGWRVWPDHLPLPEIRYVVQCWDTAYTKDEVNDESACTTWGVFVREGVANVMLLGCEHAHLEFHDLVERAKELRKTWDPDEILIEPKASGKSVIQELRRQGVPVMPWSPERGFNGREVDKTARAQAASIYFAAGCIWRPDRKWAEEVAKMTAAYPHGAKNDVGDTVTMVAIWLRRSWQMHVSKAEADEDEEAREAAAKAAKGAPRYG